MTARRAVVIGASAGALDALSALLPALPADFPLPIMLVVHLPAHQDSLLADLLQARCALRVIEAEDKQPIEAGTVHIAPPDYHLLVEKDASLSLSSEEAVHFSRPSIDVLFESAADAYGAALVGVILSGANADGARGLARIAAAGGLVLVQDPGEAMSAEMPRAARDLCPQAEVLSLAQMARSLANLEGD